MNLRDERERRWFAYFHGEVGDAERKQIEAEMDASPGEAAEVKRIFEGLSDWAEAPVPHSPVDLSLLGLEEAGPALGRKWSRVPRLAWALAASALLVFALSQVSFSVIWGTAEFAWGEEEPAGEDAGVDPALLAAFERITELEERSVVNDELIQALSVQAAEAQQAYFKTAAELARGQEREAQARHRDMEQIVRFAGFGDLTARARE